MKRDFDMRNPIKIRNREALAWAFALCLFALWSGPAWAQSVGEMPGGTYIISMMDAAVSYIRVYFGPILTGTVFFSGIFGCAAGDWSRGVGRAMVGLFSGAMVMASVVWWPWVKTLFVA